MPTDLSKLWQPDTEMLSVVTGMESARLTAGSAHCPYNGLLPNDHRGYFCFSTNAKILLGFLLVSENRY